MSACLHKVQKEVEHDFPTHGVVKGVPVFVLNSEDIKMQLCILLTHVVHSCFHVLKDAGDDAPSRKEISRVLVRL